MRRDVYGLGLDKDITKAQLKTLTDIAWQLSARLNSVTMEMSGGRDDTKKGISETLTEQVTETTVIGAKFIEEYESPNGETWLLARKPLACTLDILESVLVRYSLKQEVGRKDIKNLLETVVEKLAEKRLINPGIKSMADIPEYIDNFIVNNRIQLANGERLVYIEGGTFTMGSPEDEPGRYKRESPLKFLILLILSVPFHAIAKEPNWLISRPQSDQYFYGRGNGNTAQVAEESAILRIDFPAGNSFRWQKDGQNGKRCPVS